MCNLVSFQIQCDPFKLIAETLKKQIGYLKDPEPRITQLDDAMKTLQAKKSGTEEQIRLAKRAGEGPTPQVLDWLAKVHNMNINVEKIIAKHKKGRFRWCTNRGAARILPALNALSVDTVDAVTIRLLPGRVEGLTANELRNQSFVLDTYLSELKTALKDDKCQMIGIWGMGGVGKTTLLDNLNSYLMENQHSFNHVIWPKDSEHHELVNLQQDIAKRLDLSSSEDTGTHARNIRKFLKDESFLLLLNDLWKSIDLAKLGIPFTSTNQKVIFTTCSEDVCRDMNAQKKIKIDCLCPLKAWQLFLNKVGEETLQAHERIPLLAREVVEKCDGLPLALARIGSAMKGKKEQCLWHDAIELLQKSMPHQIQSMEKGFFSKLKLCYDNLEDEILRKCFLLCSLWPERHLILKTDLIECWMGHDLINEYEFKKIISAYDKGGSFIHSLQATCLLQSGDNKKREVKMHDIIRDLALWIASNYDEKPNRFIVLSTNVIASEDSQKEMERISLVKSDISDTSSLPANCSALKTLMLQESNSFNFVKHGFFKVANTLTYLDLSNTGISSLPNDIKLLVNLQYLNLSKTKIRSLPLHINLLSMLKFLFLRELDSIVIPCGVLEKLVMLSVIDMTNTWWDNWNELSKVCGYLKGVGIVLESIEDLNQLAQLSKVMTWRLGLRKLLEFNEPLQLLSASQLGSNNICSSIQVLKIEDSVSLKVVSMKSHGRHLSRLEELELNSLQELKEIDWQGECPAKILPSLAVLTIDGCHNLSNISWVIRLPSLEELTVRNCNNVHHIIGDDYSQFTHSNDLDNGVGMAGGTFPSFKRLYLKEMRSLSTIFVKKFTMPSFELLEVIECPEMKTLPFGEEIVRLKLKGIHGTTEWWNELNMEDNVRAMLLPYFQLLGLVIN